MKCFFVLEKRLGKNVNELLWWHNWQVKIEKKRAFAIVYYYEINELNDSLLISKEYLDGLGLKDFMRERKSLNHIQLKNNQLHK